MSSPFDDDTFVRGMEAVLKVTKNSSNGLLGRLENTDKETDPVLYYSYDCALCYLTYKSLKVDFDPENNVIENLIKRVNSNIEIMKKEGGK